MGCCCSAETPENDRDFVSGTSSNRTNIGSRNVNVSHSSSSRTNVGSRNVNVSRSSSNNTNFGSLNVNVSRSSSNKTNVGNRKVNVITNIPICQNKNHNPVIRPTVEPARTVVPPNYNLRDKAHFSAHLPNHNQTIDSWDEVQTENQNYNTQLVCETATSSKEIIELWDEVDVLCETVDVPHNIAYNFVRLLNDGCTLPFIARYRKNAVNYLMPNQLQELFDNYENIRQLKKKVNIIINELNKTSKLTPDVKKRILNARNLGELDLVYDSLKSEALTVAEKARKLGLEPQAVSALNGDNINLKSLCKADENISTVTKVLDHMTHLVADIIHTDARVMVKIRYLKDKSEFFIQSKKETNDNKKNDSKSNPETYKLYFDWKCRTEHVKPHQILALNRGEEAKLLTVKIVVPDSFYQQLERYCLTLWKSDCWVKIGLQNAFKKHIKPWLCRQVRSDLTNLAYQEAVKTFIANLESLLLTEPIKNRNIAGLDPGFTHGCKVGMINKNGECLDVRTLYPDLRLVRQHDSAASHLKTLLTTHSIEIIGLGNGTACRETEMWLKHYGVSDNYPVIIVPEQGASVYSVSKEAQKEHPNMDPNLISALSIARRVLDPLGELIKVEPKHLGIGYYQHDIPPKMLESALDYTVEKIVSLVGVDINTASLAMLRRISGLDESRALKILAYRQEKGNFTSRTQILNTGIGEVSYQQCVGFLKVYGSKEPLDSTIIHPESYSISKRFAEYIGVDINDLKQPYFPEEVEKKTLHLNKKTMSQKLGTDTATLELILHAFKQKNYENNVISFCRPVYSVSVQALDELREGMTIIGRVLNVVPFGCFVDCGVGTNGLIHRNHLRGNRTPKLGERVSVTVLPSKKPNKIQLRLEAIIQ